MNEKKLANQLAEGDTAALGEVIERYSGYVRTVARNVSGGALTSEDIDEIAVDSFYKLWTYRENIKPETGLHAYLSAIARSVALNRLRQRKPAAEDISELEIPSGDFTVEELAELNDMMSCLNEGLSGLPKRDRDIFLRFYLYGESSPQISRAMNIPENTIYTKLRRTKAKLKEYLTERGYNYV